MIHTSIDTNRNYVKMKKDVYEHLAKTFLENKSKKKVSNRHVWIFTTLIVISCLLLILQLSSLLAKRSYIGQSFYVIQDKSPIEFEYDFTEIGNNKIRVMLFNLSDIDLDEYSYLSLAARTKDGGKIKTSLSVQIENSLHEKDSEYISGIVSEWQTFILPLSDFENVNDWSKVESISFVIEEWNTGVKRDKIYIDEVRFIDDIDEK